MTLTVHQNQVVSSNCISQFKSSKYTLERRAIREIRAAKKKNLDNVVILGFWHLESDHPEYVKRIMKNTKRCASYLGLDIRFFVHRSGGDLDKNFLCAKFNNNK